MQQRFWVLLGDIFIVPFFGLALGYLTAIVTRGGEIWLQLTGIWRQIFKKCQITTPCPASPYRRLNIDRCIIQEQCDVASFWQTVNNLPRV